MTNTDAAWRHTAVFGIGILVDNIQSSLEQVERLVKSSHLYDTERKEIRAYANNVKEEVLKMKTMCIFPMVSKTIDELFEKDEDDKEEETE